GAASYLLGLVARHVRRGTHDRRSPDLRGNLDNVSADRDAVRRAVASDELRGGVQRLYAPRPLPHRALRVLKAVYGNSPPLRTRGTQRNCRLSVLGVLGGGVFSD